MTHRSNSSRRGVELLEERRLLSTVAALTTDSRLLIFDSSNPQAIFAERTVSGLGAGETLVGIDVRPATGELYGLGSAGMLYTINPSTGVATLKAALTADPADATDPFTALSGADFGIDFNPVPDRLRVVSDTGANLRINPDTGQVTTDTPLAYDPADPKGGGKAPAAADAAYTNNVVGATTTTLYLIDKSFYNTKTLVDNSTVTAMSFVIQGGVDGNPSPNTGVLTTSAAFGRDGVTPVGFDIAPSGKAYTGVKADFSGGTRYLLVEVDPTSPVDSSHGNIGDGSIAIQDLAILPTVQLSAPVVAAVEGGNASVTVTRTDGAVGAVTVDITSLGATAIPGLDFKPTTQTLTFAPGETSKTFDVAVSDDSVAEDDEYFSINLSNLTGAATFGYPSTAAVRISSNDDLDDVVPTVTSVLLTGPSRGISGAVVKFSEDMDPASAGNVANYTFSTRAKKKTALTITSAVYDPVTRSTTLSVAPFAQTQFKSIEIGLNNKTGGITDASGNLLSKTSSKFTFNVFTGTTVTVTDRDGDKATLMLANGGQIDGITPVKSTSRTQRTQFWILDPIALRTTLTGNVTRGTKGDGIIVIAEIIGLDKKEFTPLLNNPSFRVNTLTFSSNATGVG